MTSTPFYTPLQQQEVIRLLRLKPGNDENGIDVILKSFDLNSAIEFNALSYVWGSPTPQRWISCNGNRVSITPNLHGALSQLVQQGFDGLLWVDALCINQQDDEEKSAQVAMMREIFGRAAKVIFWLGEQQEFDEDGARLMGTFFQNHPERLIERSLRDKSLGELGLPDIDYGWFGWASLLARPWFERVWIVQEFLNAKESVFMSGAVEIPTKVLMHCAGATSFCPAIKGVFLIQGEDVFSASTHLERPMYLYIAQSNAHIVGKVDLDINDIWKRSRLLQATDERDRVFALLSFQTMLPMDMINYSKNVVEVYTEVAKIALTHPMARTRLMPSQPSSQRSCNALENEMYRSSRFLACKDGSLGESELPSWVPDWKSRGFMFVPLTDHFHGTSSFVHPYQDAFVENKTMSISGVLVDRPWAIVDSRPYMENVSYHRLERREAEQAARKWADGILNWQYMCYVLARSKNAASRRHGLLAAFCRTLAFSALSKYDDATVAEYIGGFQAQRKRMLRKMAKVDRHGAVFEGPESSSRRCVEYEGRFGEFSQGRKFCVTQAGRLAWIPQVAKPGDEICFLAGCAVPFVIRRAGESWELLGDCYLDGLMSEGNAILRQQPQVFKFT